MPPIPLSADAAARGLTALNDQIGRADRDRLARLLPLIAADRRIPLAAALDALYPGQPREAALTALRQMRKRLADAAREAGIKLGLKTERGTRSTPAQRACWFTGDDQAVEAAARESKAGTAPGDVEIRQHATEAAKRFFVSYAHDDEKLKNDLLKRLRPWLGSAPGDEYAPWQDRDIPVGEDWHAEIQKAIDTCEFGLLLVSPAFLASKYITGEELHHFLPPGPDKPPRKAAVPVALRALRFDGMMDMKGLESRQIFHDKAGKAFQERSNDKTKYDFVSELFAEITRKLRAHVTPPSAGTSTSAREKSRSQRDALEHDLVEIHHEPMHAQTMTLDKLDTAPPADQRREALTLLNEWVNDETGPPLCALLGETGMGKTTTCKAFTHGLLDAREAGKSVRLPIYLDLRLLGEDAKSLPRLDAVIDTILQRSWQGGRTEPPPSAAEVQRLVREDGAVIIFDGLDEVLVHLPQRAGQQFTRELLSILPPALWPRRRAPAQPGRPGRILLTCRTHYFRSVRDQNTHFTAEDRDDVRATDYRVFMLLPFTDDQIRAYLTASLPGEDIDRVLATIRSVHNLPELAERPYTLSLITRHLPRIEAWKLEGRRVTGVDLYRHMVLSWLERDAGKHELDTDHKQQIMEHVAAQLWRAGSRTWTARQMEDWLGEFLDATPAVARHYRGKDLEVLKKDLRTATFLVGGGEADFRFAHTSLQEFFLAGFLLRALRESRVADWDLPKPSRETLDFLGQMLLGEADGAALATLRAMREPYRPRISERAFDYVLFAQARGYPAPAPAGFVLDGADLRDWAIEGRETGPLLNLRGASFRGARLGNAVFRRVDLDDADFSGADLLRVEVNRGHARGARFAGAALPGAVLRDLDLTGATFAGARPHRTQILRCDLTGAAGLDAGPPALLLAGCAPAVWNDRVNWNGIGLKKFSRLASLDGHAGWVHACAFSPDGKRIASAGENQTIRVWDAASGDLILTAQGHQGMVRTCAFSPDGKRIASAGDDQTIRLWDAASGDLIRTAQGHQGMVRACAFSPDGKRIASAGDDGTLRLWDAASGDLILTAQGHQGTIWACAFSSDGKRIASAGDDKTIRVWDAASGDLILTAHGHQGTVLACAFSPDGKRIASAGDDQTIRLWDAASGALILTAHGHQGAVLACAFSSDGKRIASAGDDKTIRLWDAASGDLILTANGHQGTVLAFAFSPDGKRIASAGDDKTIRLWDAASGDLILTAQGHQGTIWACAFSPDGKRIASAGNDKTIRVWDAASGDLIRTAQGHQGTIRACAFSPDGKRIASAGFDQTVRLWDAASGDLILTAQGHQGAIWACAFSPDGKRIASAGDDKTIRVWDAASGDLILTANGHQGPVTACAFAPDGKRIASAGYDKTIRLWDAASGDLILTANGHDSLVLACAFSPDGKRIASAGSDQTVRVWDAASGDLILTAHGHEGTVRACAFSPDGKRIASAGFDQTVRLWDAASGDLILTAHGHEGTVRACAFSPDGKRIASAGEDGTLRLWDAASGAAAGFRVHLYGDGDFASLAVDGTRAIRVSQGAWRYLGWLVPDAGGALTRYPAEVFGPLPEAQAAA